MRGIQHFLLPPVLAYFASLRLLQDIFHKICEIQPMYPGAALSISDSHFT